MRRIFLGIVLTFDFAIDLLWFGQGSAERSFSLYLVKDPTEEGGCGPADNILGNLSKTF